MSQALWAEVGPINGIPQPLSLVVGAVLITSWTVSLVGQDVVEGRCVLKVQMSV